MTMTETETRDDAPDRVLSLPALRQAARDGDKAAAVLLVLTEGWPVGELAKTINMVALTDAAPPRAKEIREMAAGSLAQAALHAPNKKIRKAARRYLENDTSGSFHIGLTFRPIVEARAMAAEPDGPEGEALAVFFSAPERQRHCVCCEGPLVSEPAEVASGFYEGIILVNGVCAACAASPGEMKQGMTARTMAKAIKDAKEKARTDPVGVETAGDAVDPLTKRLVKTVTDAIMSTNGANTVKATDALLEAYGILMAGMLDLDGTGVGFRPGDGDFVRFFGQRVLRMIRRAEELPFQKAGRESKKEK
jgi:hypothetical protein